MNPYLVLGSRVGTPEATWLSDRLSAWHDAMVAHERRLKNPGATDRCNDECPHAEADGLWTEAMEVFGDRARDLTFLRERADAGAEARHRAPGSARLASPIAATEARR